jgi:AraC-like DNA-binding protein
VPTGGVHLVLRLDDSRIRIFDGVDSPHARSFTAVVGGARSSFHVREVLSGACSIGIQLRPGAAGAVLGVPAGELAERHTALEDVWGPLEARRLRDRLMETRSDDARLQLLEAVMATRVTARHAPHPAVQQALARFDREASGPIGPVRRDARLSHRRFVQLFRRDVGLGPKQLCRVLRLGHALRLASRDHLPWAQVAAAAGYCDQSHLVRELRRIAGVSPSEWAALSSGQHPHHIPVVNSVQDRRATARL